MWNINRNFITGTASCTAFAARQNRSGRRTRDSQQYNVGFFTTRRQFEMEYPPWWTSEGFIKWFRNLPDETLWNCYICAIVLAGVVWIAANLESSFYLEFIDIVYNITYAVHVLAIAFRMVTELEHTLVSFLIDLLSYSHYISTKSYLKLACYYVRLHRPLKYLWSLNNNNLKCSILGTTLKYCYIFMVLRTTWAWIWLRVSEWQHQFPVLPRTRRMGVQLLNSGPNESDANNFISSLYIVNKMFIPIGVPVSPQNDVERLTCLLVILSGCLVVTGAAVAALSLVVSLYMSPEETFRSRYRLIIKDMKDSHVPPSMREKVQKFYRMYWHKQRAVSQTRLLPTFPPTLPATVYTDIYFEATQKSPILRDLSDHFLSKLAKNMETIHYIPGDVIIERNARKSAIIFITYGDIEMLTAEDDITAILRLTRGTVLTPCGGAAAGSAVTSHLAVRAATFCTAHVLHAADLWRVVFKYSVDQNHGEPILAAFVDHIEKVKRHYAMKIPDASVHKSSILHFNRNLLALKEMKDAEGKSLLANTDVFLEIAGCYIMRNRLDSTLTDEADEICLRPTFPCILQPSSSLQLAWHSAVSCLILVICITHPYYLVYSTTVPMGFRFFDYVATAIYVVDHVVHLSTGAQVEEGIPITFAQTSSQQMRSKWFVLDVVGTLPIFELIGDGHFAGINKILRLPKVFRVLKIIEEKCMYHSNVLRFCSYTLLLLIACYLIAALQQAFMCYHSGYCQVTNFTHSPFWDKKEMDKDTVAASITFGLYWAISMIMFTTHIETWARNNISNVVYTMIILEVCIVLRTFMEAVYSATIMVTTAMWEEYGSRIATVRQFLIRNDVDPELRKRFITYLQLCWYTDKAYRMTHHKENSSIFHDLPQHVYRDIVGRQRIKYMLSIPVMKMLKIEELNLLASSANLFYTSPNEILLNTGDLVNEIYVVVKGICEMISPSTHKTVDYLTTNNHFGAVGCLLRLPAYYTVRAVTHVQIFCISKRHLKPVFENPQVKQAMEYIKTVPLYAQFQTGQPSFLKYEPPPPTPNMSRFKLPRKHEPDYEYLHPFKRLGFLSILRYIFPRFTIRPDGDYLIRYEWVRVSCALLSAILFPNYTFLVLQWPWLYYVALLLDTTAVFDIFQRMLVGYYNEDGILVYHPSSTAAYYIKGPFIVDLIGCLPLEKLESESVGLYEDMYRVTPMEQFLMMNRLVQLYRFPSITQTLQYYIERRDIQMVIYAVPLFISMFNILTSLMIFNSVKIFWFVKQDGETGWLLQPFDDKGGSWIDLFGSTFRFNLTSSPFNLYLATHFWVVYETTTTGYAKFKPSNKYLMEILFIGMTMSGMIITYFSVRIISIRANVNKAHAGFKQHMKDITTFMDKENVSKELIIEMRRYYEYNWEKMGGIDYSGVLKLCDQITLRTDAILHIYGPTFAKCPLLAQCDLSLLRMIGRSVRSVYFLRNMKIVEYDDVVKHIYFVDYGGVESRVPVGDMNQVVRLPRGSLFGNLEGSPAQRVPMNIVATSRLHLLMINSQAFYHIINEFPATKALMDIARKTDNQYYILGNIEDFKVKMSQERASEPASSTSRNLFKYIYYQESAVLMYLIFVSLIGMFIDLYNAGYQDNRAWLILTLYVLDMCFFLKILMQFSLPLLVTDKNLKTLLPIRTLYFKREFKYDMVSCVPIELLAFQSVKNRWLWFSWLRLNRMFRIVTVRNCLKQHNERITVNLVLSTVLTVTIWFSLFVHATTCLWYFIGRLEELDEPKSSWIYSGEGFNWCRSEYICSLYFVITTFTQNGVGDIMPKKQSEVIFVTILMIISTMVFMVYVGEFSKLIQYHSFRLFSFYSKYLELQDFLKNNRVSSNLVSIVNKYTIHLWRTSRGLQVPQFLTNAPLSLRLRVMSAAYMHHIDRHPIFEDCEPAFLRQLVGCLRPYIYNEDMYVVKESEITNSMYIIHTGTVRETAEVSGEQVLPRVYPAGSYFGVVQGLVRDTPYTHTYQTVTKSQVLTLQLEDWEYLLKHFPNSKATIHKHMGSVAENVPKTKWPGGHDPEPPPATKSTNTDPSNLPQFYQDETSEFDKIEKTSNESLPKNPKSSEIVEASPSFETISRDSIEDKPVTDVRVFELKDDKNAKATEGGLIEYISKTVKKLMGRYSDTDVSSLETDEEEATQALLKQLDEARRITREIEKKNPPRYNPSVTVHSKEEETEKYMLSLGIFTNTSDKDEGLNMNTQMLTPRPLQIRDNESGAVTEQDNSEISSADLDEDMMAIPFTVTKKTDKMEINRSDENIQDTTSFILHPDQRKSQAISEIIVNRTAEILDKKIGPKATSEIKSTSSYKDDTSTSTSTTQRVEINGQLKNRPKEKDILKSQDELRMSTDAGPKFNTSTPFTSELGPSWGTRVVQETDADIELLPYHQLNPNLRNETDNLSHMRAGKENSGSASKISTSVKTNHEHDSKRTPGLSSASYTTEAPSWGSRVIQETDADLETIAKVSNEPPSDDNSNENSKSQSEESSRSLVDTNTNLKSEIIPTTSGDDAAKWGSRIIQETDADIVAIPDKRLQPVDTQSNIRATIDEQTVLDRRTFHEVYTQTEPVEDIRNLADDELSSTPLDENIEMETIRDSTSQLNRSSAHDHDQVAEKDDNFKPGNDTNHQDKSPK